ncbi:hypothetical protein LEP1GSC036_0823 [Leptospira weilii str. 2006001853]|uniref:Uncharacterized protein n=1 Tax=Leptospira weilii str. 2006001853 TaxID=1001589 RepID=A0A828Z9M1_9LEPT|nr:hypothetical protein LEP1GSC036_0823 [Leptospira weilii str. 2006001853]
MKAFLGLMVIGDGTEHRRRRSQSREKQKEFYSARKDAQG